jgi:hypothetical protein
MAGNIDRFVARMIYWCRDASVGYDQANRWDLRDDGRVDCSSFVILVGRETGFDTGNATYTGNMSAEFTKHGWKRIPNNGAPQKGDILLNDVHHVAVYLGNGLVAQASSSEYGTAYGKAGDQTGRETNIRGYYNYPWNCYLRYVGVQSTETKKTLTTTAISKIKDDEMVAFYHMDEDIGVGYPKGAVVMWNPSSSVAFYVLPNRDALAEAKRCYPNAPTVGVSRKYPAIIRALQATPKALRSSWGVN